MLNAPIFGGNEMRLPTAIAALVTLILATNTHAVPVYQQTDPGIRAGATSDRDFGVSGVQAADDFTLSQPATIRSVEWRGWYFGNGTIEDPINFDIIIYGDDSPVSRPDLANVISSTSVVYNDKNKIPPTGRTAFGPNNGPEFHFAADISPLSLNAGTRYWISILADTTTDTNDSFLWTVNTNGFVGELAAARTNIAPQTQFLTNQNGPFYFILDDEFVPEPASIALLSIAGLTLARRRRA